MSNYIYLLMNRIYDNTPVIIEDFLQSFGFDTLLGKVIIYFVIMLLINFVLVYKKFNTFLTLLVNIVIFGVFVYFGWIPTWMLIILGLTYLLGIFASIKGGLLNE